MDPGQVEAAAPPLANLAFLPEMRPTWVGILAGEKQ